MLKTVNLVISEAFAMAVEVKVSFLKLTFLNLINHSFMFIKLGRSSGRGRGRGRSGRGTDYNAYVLSDLDRKYFAFLAVQQMFFSFFFFFYLLLITLKNNYII
jgi:hypothetical protein